MNQQCLNCEKNLEVTDIFCSQCGQKAQLHRLNWHDIWHDAIHYFTHADKGIFHLLVQLLTKTGSVAREFIQGKRKKYFPPFNFFLIVATIYVFIFALNASPAASSDIERNHPEINRIQDAKKREHLANVYKRADKARVFMNKHSNMVAMLALPLLAFLCYLFYLKAGYNYVEHLVACMYMSGFTLLVQVLIFVPVGLLLKHNNPNIMLSLFFLFQLIYFSIYYYHFINRRTKGGAVKAFFVSFFIIAFWGIISYFFVKQYISHGFWGLMT